MKSLMTLVVLAGALAPAQLPAQSPSDHAAHRAPGAAKAAMSEGEVRKVDKAARKITLKHGPLANLGMPPMTMVFVAADPAMVDRVKVGDKVRFVAENVGGEYTVTRIEPAN